MVVDGDQVIPKIKAIIILDEDGTRITSKYYGNTEKDSEKQTAFEKLLYNKTSRLTTPRHDGAPAPGCGGQPGGTVDIMMIDDQVAVFHFVSDLLFYVVGHSHENELILEAVLTGLIETLQQLLESVEKISLLEQLELTILAIDEIVDSGMILETDPNIIAARVSMSDAHAETPLAEQSLSQVAAGPGKGLTTGNQVMAAARDQMTRALLQ